MSALFYNWQRFWCPRDSGVIFDNGFIEDPDGRMGKFLNPNVKHIEEFDSYKCLILLGEPGLGKSFEVERNKKIICSVGAFDILSMVINLNSYDSTERFDRKIFQSIDFKKWFADKNSILYLTLESFDECLIQVDSLTDFLLEELQSLPYERLFLRIVCRTGYWSAPLEKGLLAIYKESVKIIELMPLRKGDVLEAARVEGIDSKKFLDGVFSIGITAFASRPITLKILIDRFKKTEELPKNQIEMYQQGCLKLCDEVNETRFRKITAGKLLSQQKMIIAGRIATALAFSNNSTLWMYFDDGNMPDGAMSMEAIFGYDNFNEQPILVDRDSVIETSATGLFSARGLNQMGWAHLTYGEFLVANYLIQHSVNEKRIMNLIAPYEGRIIPKFYSIAAWLAVMNRRIFEIIIKNEPEILLLGDITVITEDQKYALTELYLSRIDALNGISFDMKTNLRYDRLMHDTLAEQLRPYIIDFDINEPVRIEAMSIALACSLNVLGNSLVNVALEHNESINIRSMAAFAASRIAVLSERSRLRELIQTNTVGTDDRIKGHALAAIWPENLTVEELFAFLTPQKLEEYRTFISGKLIQGLSPSDLPVALQWLIDQTEVSRNLSFYFDLLTDDILRYAWDNIETAGVLDLFAKIVLQRINSYREIIGDRYGNNPFKLNPDDHTKRRLLVEKLVSMIDPQKNDFYNLIISKPPLVSIEDAEWLIGKINKTSHELIREKRSWGHLLNWTWKCSGSSLDIMNSIYSIYKSTPTLADIFSASFDAIELASEEAKHARKIHETQKKYEEKKKTEIAFPKLNTTGHIQDALDQLEQGESDAWWVLIHWMAYAEDGTHSAITDITISIGWDFLDNSKKEQMAAYAQAYLLAKKTQINTDLKTFCETDSAAYKGLVYLKNYAVEIYNLLPVDVWKKWAMVIVLYPIWEDRDSMPIHKKIIQRAYNKVPHEICKCLGEYIDSEKNPNVNLEILDKFELCRDADLSFFLFEKIKKKTITIDTSSKIICKLLDWDFKEVLIYSKEIIYNSNEEKALSVAAALLFHGPINEWTFIWDKIIADAEFGKSLMLRVAHFSEYKKSYIYKLSEKQLEDFYIWLVINFPYEEDPQHNDGHAYSPSNRDAMIHFRDGIFHILQSRGNSASCEAIERISYKFPKSKWLVNRLEKANKIRIENKWIPYNPKEILSLIHDKSNSRLIKDEEQLLDVVMEALSRIQLKLQGETPLAPLLWDQIVKKPKWENDFSDFIVSQLRDELVHRGIILSREVEIRSSRSGQEGERTDIHIDAISSNNSHDVLKVIVEVKGCWHQELTTAMESQLHGKYLKDNDCKCGIYLVGWFNCPQWNPADPRKKKAFRNDFNSLVMTLNSQAKKLSRNGCILRAFILDSSLRFSCK